MKLKAIAAACTMAFASQAYALTPAQMLVPGTSTLNANMVHLFISGSSALQVTIGQIASSLFQPGTIDTYFDTTGNGANYRAYSGTFKTNLPAQFASLDGKPGVVYEQARGGSLMGIVPVATASAVNTNLPNTEILDLTTCTSTGTTDPNSTGNLWTCTGALNAVADGGVSDVEPAMFTGINVPAGAPVVTPAISAALSVGPSLGQPMAIILTSNNTLTSLSKPQVTGIMSGYNPDWSYVDSSLASSHVVICRRTPGSGTQASINDFFFGFPCSSSQLIPAVSSVGSGSAGAWVAPIVIENSGSGQLAACMTAAQLGTAAGYTISITDGTLSTAAQDSTHITLPAGGMAIGLMGLDRPPQTIKTAAINGASAGVTETYKFAAIDGVQPTIENAVIGNYDVVVNNSWNTRSVTVNGIAPLSGDQATFYAAMKSNSGNSAILGACKTPPVPGVAALADPVNLNYDPTTTSCTANGTTYTNILLNPVMRTAKSNSCQPAQQVQ